jgi:hypothetical protein
MNFADAQFIPQKLIIYRLALQKKIEGSLFRHKENYAVGNLELHQKWKSFR